jgi:hypothetical protein
MAWVKRSGPRSASQRRLVAMAWIRPTHSFFARSLELDRDLPQHLAPLRRLTRIPPVRHRSTQVVPMRAVVLWVLLANVRLLLAGSESWTDANGTGRD